MRKVFDFDTELHQTLFMDLPERMKRIIWDNYTEDHSLIWNLEQELELDLPVTPAFDLPARPAVPPT
jgi:hypothetical protein